MSHSCEDHEWAVETLVTFEITIIFFAYVPRTLTFFVLLFFSSEYNMARTWTGLLQRMKTGHDMHRWLLWWLPISVMRIKCKSIDILCRLRFEHFRKLSVDSHISVHMFAGTPPSLPHQMKTAHEMHRWCVIIAEIKSGPWKGLFLLWWQSFSLRRFFELSETNLISFSVNNMAGTLIGLLQEMQTVHNMHRRLLWMQNIWLDHFTAFDMHRWSAECRTYRWTFNVVLPPGMILPRLGAG